MAGRKIASELFGLFCLLCAALLFISLLSFSPADPSLNHVIYGKIQIVNWAGMFGAYLSALCIDLFGFASYIIAIFFAVAGMHFMLRAYPWPWWRWCGFLLLFINLAASSGLWELGLGDIRAGGLLGRVLRDLSLYLFNPLGSGFIWAFVFLLVLQLIFNFSWRQAGLKGIGNLRRLFEESAEIPVNLPEYGELSLSPYPAPEADKAVPKPKPDKPKAEESKADEPEEEAAEDQELLPPCLTELSKVILGRQPDGLDRPVDQVNTSALRPERENIVTGAAGRVLSNGRLALKFPPLGLLSPVNDSNSSVSKAEQEEKGRALMTCLTDFSIQAELIHISPGPVVTSFEVRPAPGVKIARIVGLSDDLALGLKAVSVRIHPIPGTDTIGIEIPNAGREVVGLRELLEAPSFQSQNAPLLNMALGKNISGHPVFADLAKMPHMLVAGATGAGKSVFLNTVLLSFLYRAQPEELKLLLIDPKRVEMSVYADLPHLVHPIVVEPVLAKNALDWAVAEMDKRYAALERLGVRNMQAYNQKVQKLPESGSTRLPDSTNSSNAADSAHLSPMSSLVIIIDELADLMLTAGKDIEASIMRLGQLARAAGIYLIVATQRPSVNVVTGL
ncbi:MAG: DNA translocase FtsK 4TM domain-containing protein, partial [Deltaproteobacteria bacterium]|nr:DNA translocase FtsK 4TM domain-containing protein [Deltaproteobacteria bacterium]